MMEFFSSSHAIYTNIFCLVCV